MGDQFLCRLIPGLSKIQVIQVNLQTIFECATIRISKGKQHAAIYPKFFHIFYN
jgi:hypothetical protein